MTEKQSFKLVATKLDIPKNRLRNTIPFTNEVLLDLIEQIYEKALDNLIDYLKEVIEGDIPYEVLRAFAFTYFNLEVKQDYDIETMNYKLVCIPEWKDVNEINTKSEEFKLLEKYSWEGDVE